MLRGENLLSTDFSDNMPFSILKNVALNRGNRQKTDHGRH